jgi:hypothetical protein
MGSLADDVATQMAKGALQQVIEELTRSSAGVRPAPPVRYTDPSHPDAYGEVRFDYDGGQWGASVINFNNHCRLVGWRQQTVPPETALLVARGVAGSRQRILQATVSILSDRGPVTGDYLDRSGQKHCLGECGTGLPPGEWFPVTLGIDTPADLRIFCAIQERLAGNPTWQKLNRGALRSMNLESVLVTTGKAGTPDFATHCMTVTLIHFDPKTNRFTQLPRPYLGFFTVPRGGHRYVETGQRDFDTAAAGRYNAAEVAACLGTAQFTFMEVANQILEENGRVPGATDTVAPHIVSMQDVTSAAASPAHPSEAPGR